MIKMTQQHVDLVAAGENLRGVGANAPRGESAREKAMIPVASEAELAALAFAVAGSDASLTEAERAIVPKASAPPPSRGAGRWRS